MMAGTLATTRLRLVCAGFEPDEEAFVEKVVRTALGQRPAGEYWVVAIARAQGKWSITLDGPGRLKGIKLHVAETDARAAIARAVRGSGIEVPEAPEDFAEDLEVVEEAARATFERRERLDCPRCKHSFELVYDSEPDEPTEPAPVACPHCWQVEHWPVAHTAALERDYRTEKIEG